MSNSVKQQLIQDLQLAGLGAATQKNYLAIVVRFVNRARTRPRDATEAQVAEYLRGLIGQGVGAVFWQDEKGRWQKRVVAGRDEPKTMTAGTTSTIPAASDFWPTWGPTRMRGLHRGFDRRIRTVVGIG